MRIISGKWRRRSIHFPKSKYLRPTQDRVREAVFSKLQGIEKDANVLDLCCGTGSLGLEALSRGANYVCFVDSHTQTVKKNVELLGCSDQVDVFTQRIQRFLRSCKQKFSLIFLDPPWHEHQLYSHSLKVISENDILESGGFLVVEFSVKSPPMHFESVESTRYGGTAVTILSQSFLKKWASDNTKED